MSCSRFRRSVVSACSFWVRSNICCAATIGTKNATTDHPPTVSKRCARRKASKPYPRYVPKNIAGSATLMLRVAERSCPPRSMHPAKTRTTLAA
jgi:hypothetical protein